MARTLILNQDGSVSSSSDSQAITVTGSQTPGSNVAVFPFGIYWNSSYNANDIGTLNVPVVNNANQNLGQHGCVFKAQTATTITAVEMCEQGPCNGTHVVNLRVNGVTPGTNITMGTGSGTSQWTQPANISMAAGDVLTGYVSVNASGNTQVSVYLTATVASA